MSILRRIVYLLAVIPVVSYADESLPSKVEGPLESKQLAEQAVSYFGSKVSQLSPCGQLNTEYSRTGDQWFILETIMGYKTKKISWRLWQLNANDASVISVNSNQWIIDPNECKNT